MGIESTESALVVTGRDAIRFYDVLSIRSALALEIKTGMRFSNRVRLVPVAISRGYVTEGTRDKRKAYLQLDKLVVSLGGEARPLPARESAPVAE